MSEMYKFITEKMKVLLVIYDNSMEIDGTEVCPLNQQEIPRMYLILTLWR